MVPNGIPNSPQIPKNLQKCLSGPPPERGPEKREQKVRHRIPPGPLNVAKPPEGLSKIEVLQNRYFLILGSLLAPFWSHFGHRGAKNAAKASKQRVLKKHRK